MQRFFAELDIFDQGDGEEWLARMGLKPSPVERSRTPEAARADLRLVATALTGRGSSGEEALDGAGGPRGDGTRAGADAGDPGGGAGGT